MIALLGALAHARTDGWSLAVDGRLASGDYNRRIKALSPMNHDIISGVRYTSGGSVAKN